MTKLVPWSARDFADSFQRHMPTGPVWPRDPDAVQRATVEALMPTYMRTWALACDLPAETLPSTAVFLLPEWEASVGLPDPCAGPDPTIAQRQAHVVARLTQQNGPSIPSLTAFAAALGYEITIQEFAPARADVSCADDPCYEPEWAFAWQVTVAATTVTYAAADASFADDPLLTTGGEVLECELNRLKPAHTVLIFNFTGPLVAAGWDTDPGWDAAGWAA